MILNAPNAITLKNNGWIAVMLSLLLRNVATPQRIISPISTKFEGVGWPDADDKWARDHERAARK